MLRTPFGQGADTKVALPVSIVDISSKRVIFGKSFIFIFHTVADLV